MNGKFRHIIWDWNGTLFDDSWLCLESMNKVLARRNMSPLTHERYMDIFEFPVINYYRNLGFDFDKEPFEISGMEFIHEYNARHHLPELQPGALKLLEEIHLSPITQSLLSAQEQKTLDVLISRFDIGHLFEKVIGLDNHYAFSKIESGLQWMTTLPFEPGEVLFVGDTDHDAQVAEELGCECILVSGGHQGLSRLQAVGPQVLTSLDELREYLI